MIKSLNDNLVVLESASLSNQKIEFLSLFTVNIRDIRKCILIQTIRVII